MLIEVCKWCHINTHWRKETLTFVPRFPWGELRYLCWAAGCLYTSARKENIVLAVEMWISRPTFFVTTDRPPDDTDISKTSPGFCLHLAELRARSHSAQNWNWKYIHQHTRVKHVDVVFGPKKFTFQPLYRTKLTNVSERSLQSTGTHVNKNYGLFNLDFDTERGKLLFQFPANAFLFMQPVARNFHAIRKVWIRDNKVWTIKAPVNVASAIASIRIHHRIKVNDVCQGGLILNHLQVLKKGLWNSSITTWGRNPNCVSGSAWSLQ